MSLSPRLRFEVLKRDGFRCDYKPRRYEVPESIKDILARVSVAAS